MYIGNRYNGMRISVKLPRIVLPLLLLLAVIAFAGVTWWRSTHSPLALGEQAFAAQEYSSALVAFTQAEQADPANPLPHLRLADIYTLKRRYPEAGGELQQVLARDPGNSDALRRVAVLAVVQGKYPEASVAWRQLLQKHPDDADAAYRLGLNELRQAHLPQAWDALQPLESGARGADWQQRARFLLLQIDLAERPELTDAVLAATLDAVIAGPNAETGNAARALKQNLAQATASDPAQRALQQAYALVQERRIEVLPLVAQLCRRAIALNSVYADAYAYLGYVQWQLGQLDEAHASLQKAVTVGPDRAAGHYFFGGLLRAQKQPDAAMAEFNRALEIDPANADVYVDYAGAALEVPDFELAEVALQKAVELQPENFTYRLAIAKFYVDHTFRIERADAHLEVALRLNPKSAQALDTLGWLQHLNKDSKTAEQTLRKAIDLDPGLASAYYHLAVVLEQLGENAEAKTAYSRAIDLDLAGEYTDRAQAALKKLG